MSIGDMHNHRVQKYSPDTSSIITVAGNANSTGCSSVACLSYPFATNLDRSGNLYIANAGANQVMNWSLSAPSGKLVTGAANGEGVFFRSEVQPLSVPS